MRLFWLSLSLLFAIFALNGCASAPTKYGPIAGVKVRQIKSAAVWECSMIAEQAADRVRATGNANFNPPVTLAYTGTTTCNGNSYNLNCATDGYVYDQSNYAAKKAGHDFAVGFMAGYKQAKTMHKCMTYNGYRRIK